MIGTLDAQSLGGRLVVSFPEEAMPAQEREEFLSFMKTEWLARRSRMTELDAERLADSVDASWWQRNKGRILARIAGEEA